MHNKASASRPPQPAPQSLYPIASPLQSLPPTTNCSVRSLTIDDHQTADPLAPRSSPGCESSPVVEKTPVSPIVHCSQYRLEQYERQNGPLTGYEKVGDWLRDVQAAYASDGPSPCQPQAAPRNLKDRYTLEYDDAERRRQSAQAALFRNGELFVHKDYEDRLPLCNYATGLKGRPTRRLHVL